MSMSINIGNKQLKNQAVVLRGILDMEIEDRCLIIEAHSCDGSHDFKIGDADFLAPTVHVRRYATCHTFDA